MQQGRSERQSFTRYHASYGSTPSSRYSRSGRSIKRVHNESAL